MNRTNSETDFEAIARSVKAACIEAALNAYEDAGMQGLCEEGRWECAVGAMKSLDAEAVARRLKETES